MMMRTAALFLFALQIIPTMKKLPASSNLKLVITIDEQRITSPYPARITMHLHNSGPQTLWLYRPALPAKSPGEGSGATGDGAFGPPSGPVEGATLAIRLEYEGQGGAALGRGDVFESVGLPHPTIIRLNSMDDFEEKTAIRLTPAMVKTADGERPLWGSYKFSVAYAAHFSNGEALRKILGAEIWEGKVASNSIEIELQPPAATATGSIAGNAVGPDNLPCEDVLVSLSDEQEHLVNQTSTDQDGRFFFTHLSPGRYWVTARRKDSTEDTTVFRHLDLTPDAPAGTVGFLLEIPETYQPAQEWHKPVLIRVTDGNGAPFANAVLEITWSSGTVVDSVKARTSEDGMAAVELIPGRNYVTVTHKKCPKDDEREDVATGPGIDGFKIVDECSKP